MGIRRSSIDEVALLLHSSMQATDSMLLAFDANLSTVELQLQGEDV